MLKVGIIGGAGYTAGELIRLLLNHPEAELSFVQSESSAGKYLWEVHEGLFGETELRFCDRWPVVMGDSSPQDVESAGIDVLFLCGSHGASREFWASHPRPAGLKVIDLAQDYRDESDGYIYGLPELKRDAIRSAVSVANPGCFATAIQLALLPLAAAGLLTGEVNVTAITGSTGAGVKPGPTTHFSWRSGNLSTYTIFEHQHLAEICRNLAVPSVNFIPIRGDFARGIFAAVHTDCALSGDEARKLYSAYYADAPFTFVAPGSVDLKQVTGTNKCLLQLEKHGG